MQVNVSSFVDAWDCSCYLSRGLYETCFMIYFYSSSGMWVKQLCYLEHECDVRFLNNRYTWHDKERQHTWTFAVWYTRVKLRQYFRYEKKSSSIQKEVQSINTYFCPFLEVTTSYSGKGNLKNGPFSIAIYVIEVSDEKIGLNANKCAAILKNIYFHTNNKKFTSEFFRFENRISAKI